MPGAPSVQYLPRSVNPRKFAYQDTLIEGKIAPTSLNRFSSALVGVNGTIDVDLHFHLDESATVVVDGRASANVVMICQRCLEEVSQTIVAEIKLAPVRDDERSKTLAKIYDPWLVDSEDGSADLYAALEDELLLALPMVACHTEPCIDIALLSAKDLSIDDDQIEKKEHPFQVLAQLKTNAQKPKT